MVCKVVWVIVSCSCILSLICNDVNGNDLACLRCRTGCNRCKRQAKPVEELISELYSGLFQAEPPSGNSDLPGFIPGDQHSSHTSDSRRSSGAAANPHYRPSEPGIAYGCCETEMKYETPNITKINEKNYTLVHLQGKYQFIPTGTCKTTLACSHGECVQKYRAHWVLVYNHTEVTTGPPVSFVPIRIQSHCECLNIGRPSG